MPTAHEKIKQNVVDQLCWDRRINASDITVAVTEGVVTLSGTVPGYAERAVAISSTWSVRGVRGVINRIELIFPQNHIQPNDSEIKLQVENILSADTFFNCGEMVEVLVDHGMVTLNGSVNSYWKKYHAESRVTNIKGVTAIKNKITVVPGEDILDQAIADNLEKAFSRNAAIEEDSITVKVELGMVTLTGTVPNWKTKEIAVDIAMRAVGVIDVIDETFVFPERQTEKKAVKSRKRKHPANQL